MKEMYFEDIVFNMNAMCFEDIFNMNEMYIEDIVLNMNEMYFEDKVFNIQRFTLRT